MFRRPRPPGSAAMGGPAAAELELGLFVGLSRLSTAPGPTTAALAARRHPRLQPPQTPRRRLHPRPVRRGRHPLPPPPRRPRPPLPAPARPRRNVLVAGGTASGKTTLVNAVLHEITAACPLDRIVVGEDTVELQCAARDHLA